MNKIDILFGMARRFHPLSEYGIETLKQAVATFRSNQFSDKDDAGRMVREAEAVMRSIE